MAKFAARILMLCGALVVSACVTGTSAPVDGHRDPSSYVGATGNNAP